MRSTKFSSMIAALLHHAGFLAAVFAVACAPCFAEQAAPQQPAMNMDHSGHEHAMDHFAHEHHMPVQSGLYSTSVADYSIPDVKLVDMNGEGVALREILSGKQPVILNFIFTTCTTICPVMSATFQKVQKQLGRRRVRMVSISIDPENDTPAKLKEYAKKFGAGPQWKMLTGSLENSIAVQRALGVFAGDKMNQKPTTFLKAQGSEQTWVRLDGLVDAPEIIREFDKINRE